MERCSTHPKEVSEEGKESAEEVEPQGDLDSIKLFKSVLATSLRPRTEVPTYDRSLNAEELIN